MTGNRILFLTVVAILIILVLGMLLLSMGSPGQTEMLASLVQLLVGVGVLVLSVRLLRNIAGRR